MPELKWLKSSYSEASGNACVEVASFGDKVLLRESDAPADIIYSGRGSLGALVTSVKAGAFRTHRC